VTRLPIDEYAHTVSAIDTGHSPAFVATRFLIDGRPTEAIRHVKACAGTREATTLNLIVDRDTLRLHTDDDGTTHVRIDGHPFLTPVPTMIALDIRSADLGGIDLGPGSDRLAEITVLASYTEHRILPEQVLDDDTLADLDNLAERAITSDSDLVSIPTGAFLTLLDTYIAFHQEIPQ
jgi:hypothetical protein